MAQLLTSGQCAQRPTFTELNINPETRASGKSGSQIMRLRSLGLEFEIVHEVGDNAFSFAYWIDKSSTDSDRRNRYSSSSPVRFS
jgi:hypothetical protein